MKFDKLHQPKALSIPSLWAPTKSSFQVGDTCHDDPFLPPYLGHGWVRIGGG